MMRRLFDLTTAALTLLLLGPAMLVIAVFIRTTMGGPVLFRQTRSGLRGREFRILKFRTMRHPRYPDEPDQDRISRVGQILRTTSMDELPQLINVLLGDMSVIGPRPTLPEQVAHYTPRQRGRLEVRPGLTGWAQVQGRNALSWPARIEYDLYYVRNHGFTLDVRILLRTVGVLLKPQGITGADGVNPGFPIAEKAAAAAKQPAAAAVIAGPANGSAASGGAAKQGPWTVPFSAPHSSAKVDPVPAEEAS
ncbi:sugar transferase [Yinghuangia soli]|uniref:sugar transferase n=1 Tax=Yinghuangia soli TaxID=2908204 RepID=UPI0025464D93|nr:sugar transferase [Yinghuangia soli]